MKMGTCLKVMNVLVKGYQLVASLTLQKSEAESQIET